jgi:hypothetical protein
VKKEIEMLNKILTLALVVLLALLLVPSKVDAWGAAHVGVTRVGPGGVYHSGRTVAAGPSGVYAGGRTTAVGAYGGAYRSGSVGAVGYGGAGYRYSAGYAGGAGYASTARYGYVR